LPWRFSAEAIICLLNYWEGFVWVWLCAAIVTRSSFEASYPWCPTTAMDGGSADNAGAVICLLTQRGLA
jgi:hypothetical protein